MSKQRTFELGPKDEAIIIRGFDHWETTIDPDEKITEGGLAVLALGHMISDDKLFKKHIEEIANFITKGMEDAEKSQDN